MSTGMESSSDVLSTASWYSASNTSNIAQTTFERSLATFKQKLAASSKKRARLGNVKATRLEDLVDEVSRAQAHYEASHQSKLHKSIVAFSKRVGHYGKVMDVMVQHHPEYVSLAWGAMKIIFGSLVEHERLGHTIVTALADVGDALSRIELAEALYPTEMMKETIVTLNCHIITFLLRALDWYESSTISRAIQSVTRPAALRYDDVIEDIKRTLDKVTDLSVAGSQAEQRDIHGELLQVRYAQDTFQTLMQSRLDEMQHQLTEIFRQQYQKEHLQAVQRQLQDLSSLVRQTQETQVSTKQTLLQEVILMKQDIKATQVDIRHQLSDIQLTQALSFIASACTIDHKAAYEHALLFQRVRKLSAAAKCAPFWNSQQLQSWDQSPAPSSIVLKANFRNRLNMRDFYVNVIGQLLQSKVAILYVLQQNNTSYSIFDVIKSLVGQALSKDSFSHTDVLISSYIRAFNSAHSVDEYTALLVDILTHFTLVYIVLDTSALVSSSMEECHRVITKVPQLLLDRTSSTVLKVMLVTRGQTKGDGNTQETQNQTTLRIPQTPKRKGKRIPQAPLRGRSNDGLQRSSLVIRPG